MNCPTCGKPLAGGRCPACAVGPALPAFAARVLWFWGMLMMLLSGAWLGLVLVGGASAQGSTAGFVLAGVVFVAGLALTILGFSRRR